MRSTHFWVAFLVGEPSNTSITFITNWGGVCLDCHAFWIEECSTNLLVSSEYGIS
jgi:hypothetical protein